MSQEEMSKETCDTCGKNITLQEERSGVHFCPKDKAFHNVGNNLKIVKEREAAAQEALKKDTEQRTEAKNLASGNKVNK